MSSSEPQGRQTPVGRAEWSSVTAGRDFAEEILAEEARLSDLERRRDDSRHRLTELRAAQNTETAQKR